jgi:hypothetical protein
MDMLKREMFCGRGLMQKCAIFILQYIFGNKKEKNRWWDCVQTDINRCKIKSWKARSKNRADWEKSIKEAKVRIVLQCHVRRRKERRRFSKKKG